MVKLEDIAEDIQKITLEKIGFLIEGKAKLLCPVSTGHLRSMITNKVIGDTVYIGTNVSYAKYVEEGTYKMKGYHFLKTAAFQSKEDVKRIIKEMFA